MTLRSIASLLISTLLVLATAGPTVIAQSNDDLRYPDFDRGRSGGFFQPRSSARPVDPYAGRSYRPAPSRAAAPRRRAPRTVVVEEVAKPKADPSTFVVVIGDTLGEQLSQGLDQVADDDDVAITRKTKAESGIARSDFYDWPKAVRELLDGDEKITLAVMMIGANDRQPIREGEETVELGTERWSQIYGARVDEIAKAFADKKIPLVWVGLPVMKNERMSSDMIALNTMIRERVERVGGVFVDTWEAFVDDENRYSAFGPDISGQNVKLRTNDGVHFTKAGARKAAHFVDIAIQRLIDTQPPTIVALPAEPGGLDAALQPGGVERLIDRQMTALPEPLGAIAIPQKPVAGPIIALTRPELAAGGTLVSARSSTRSEAAALIERVFGQGRAPDPRPGRADDFRWPRAGS